MTPSGRLPSFLNKPLDSFDAGILARLTPRQVISLTALCLVIIIIIIIIIIIFSIIIIILFLFFGFLF